MSSAAYASAPNSLPSDGQFDLGYGAAITFGAKAAVPSGYYELCVKPNAVCQLSRGADAILEDGVVRLNRRLLDQLATVNTAVNRDIRPVEDAVLYHVADRWSVSPKKGDCEDFALTKKARLLKLGWPSSALLIALATTRAGEEHAVLIARTDHGDFVLDNLRKDMRLWSPTLYRWKAIQSPQAVWAWYQFGGGTIRVAKAEPAIAIPTARVFADLPVGPDERGSMQTPTSQAQVMAVDATAATPIPAWETLAPSSGQGVRLARNETASCASESGMPTPVATAALFGPHVVKMNRADRRPGRAARLPLFRDASLLIEVDLTWADLMRERIADPIPALLSPL